MMVPTSADPVLYYIRTPENQCFYIFNIQVVFTANCIWWQIAVKIGLYSYLAYRISTSSDLALKSLYYAQRHFHICFVDIGHLYCFASHSMISLTAMSLRAPFECYITQHLKKVSYFGKSLNTEGQNQRKNFKHVVLFSFSQSNTLSLLHYFFLF